MKDKKAPKRLKLSKITLRKLTDDSLRGVAGGEGPLDDIRAILEDATPGCTNHNSCACPEGDPSGPGKKISMCC